ncbi:MAG: hypothetical protein ACRCZ2_07795 [Fusobacteriaceae bacterium]
MTVVNEVVEFVVHEIARGLIREHSSLDLVACTYRNPENLTFVYYSEHARDDVGVDYLELAEEFYPEQLVELDKAMELAANVNQFDFGVDYSGFSFNDAVDLVVDTLNPEILI